MITVPDEIKTLLHDDHCWKNIRIHFPNGERTDICNDLIVKDTVSFTESLCSQNTLKFGLCEASVFECEVVGVGNVKGATIEVFCEVECDASASGAEWKVDIQRYIYSIPYGTFLIESCQRQADMIHRKIQAYSLLNSLTFKFNKLQRGKALHVNTNLAPFSQNIMAFISENVQDNAFNLTETEMTKTLHQATVRVGESGALGWEYTDRTYYMVRYKIENNISDYLYRLKFDAGRCESGPATYGFAQFITSRNPSNFLAFTAFPRIPFKEYLEPTGGGGIPGMDDVVISKDHYLGYEYIYPYMSMTNATDISNFFTEHQDASFTYHGVYLFATYKMHGVFSRYDPISGSTEVVYTWDEEYCDKDDIHIVRYTPTNDLRYPFDRTLVEALGKYVVGNVDEINLRDLFDSFIELQGLFCGMDRFNQFFVKSIKRQFRLVPETVLYPDLDLYPESVTGGKLLPNDYQSCWYDDDYMKPFGLIQVEYKNTNDEDCVASYFLTGYSTDTDPDTYQTYIISKNMIVDIYTWDEADILAICAGIENNISGVSYMPVDFVGRGLPYVEAGDTFEILTKSNDSITTIVLNRTLSGEQTLTDSYKSV